MHMNDWYSCIDCLADCMLDANAMHTVSMMTEGRVCVGSLYHCRILQSPFLLHSVAPWHVSRSLES